jgi:penicillin-binding protein 2
MSFRPQQIDFGRRLLLAQLFVCLFFSVIGARLWYLQGIKGNYYRNMSENNRTRTIRTASPRGMIFDREGRILVRNRASFNVGLLMEDTPEPEQTVLQLAALSEVESATALEQFTKSKGNRPFEPRVVLTDLTRARLARIKVNTHQLPGVMVSNVPTRRYPNGTVAAQLFGFTREITREQLTSSDKRYRAGDEVGQVGLEKQYENVLRGNAGYVQVEVDARGTRRGELGIVDEAVGGDLYLTIDLDVQRAAEESLRGWRGAVVAMVPETGEIIALASTPTFDANLFSGHVSAQEWNQVSSDPEKPMRNRAISNIYPPGSTIKLFWALVGLQEGVITENTKVFCPGHYQLGKRRYHCHKRGGHGYVDLKTAITVSCNAYFYHLGQALGIERMAKYLESFGFGDPTGIDIPGEQPGTRPSPEWKRRLYGEAWYPGDTIPVSIGQGYLVVTPLQMAAALSALANDGKTVVPHLVKRIVDRASGEDRPVEPKFKSPVPIDQAHFAKIREFAAEVVASDRGTGRRSGFTALQVAGKTGTAQVKAGIGEQEDPRFKDHAWFVSFAPAEKPELVVVVIVENAGHGGSHAAPVAREVYKAFFQKRGMLSEEDINTPSQLAEPPVVTNAPQTAAGGHRG